jgi:hypothetical protein
MSSKENKDRKPDVRKLERQILRAMRAEGWLAPETVPEVLETEKTLADDQIEVSDASFERVRALLQSTATPKVIQLSKPKAEPMDLSENLARAAREGGTVSQEIEERMRRDRDAAEAKNGDN